MTERAAHLVDAVLPWDSDGAAPLVDRAIPERPAFRAGPTPSRMALPPR